MVEEVARAETGVVDDTNQATLIGETNEESFDSEDGNIDGLQPEQVKERLLEESRRLRESEQAFSEQHEEREEISEASEVSERTAEPTIAELREQLQAQRKELDNLQKLAARQGNEVGAVRQMKEELEALRSQMGEGLTVDQILENPDEAIERKLVERQRQQRIQELEQSIEMDEVVSQNKQVVSQYAPEFESQRDMIAKVLESDGVPSSNVQEFLSNIYRQDPAVAVQLSHRARLEAENAALRARLKDPGEILQKVDQAARRGPSVTARSGQSAPAQHKLTMDDVDGMSPEEVKAALEQIRRNK